MKKSILLIIFMCATQFCAQEILDEENEINNIIDNLLEEETLDEFIKTINNIQWFKE